MGRLRLLGLAQLLLRGCHGLATLHGHEFGRDEDVIRFDRLAVLPEGHCSGTTFLYEGDSLGKEDCESKCLENPECRLYSLELGNHSLCRLTAACKNFTMVKNTPIKVSFYKKVDLTSQNSSADLADDELVQSAARKAAKRSVYKEKGEDIQHQRANLKRERAERAEKIEREKLDKQKATLNHLTDGVQELGKRMGNFLAFSKDRLKPDGTKTVILEGPRAEKREFEAQARSTRADVKKLLTQTHLAERKMYQMARLPGQKTQRDEVRLAKREDGERYFKSLATQEAQYAKVDADHDSVISEAEYTATDEATRKMLVPFVYGGKKHKYAPLTEEQKQQEEDEKQVQLLRQARLAKNVAAGLLEGAVENPPATDVL